MLLKPKNTALNLSQQLKSLLDKKMQGHRRDMDVAILKGKFTQLIHIHPISSHVGLALIATYFDKNESRMREHSLQAIQHSKNNPIFLYNFAILLLKFKNFDKAREVLEQAFDNIHNDASTLKNIAALAYSLSAENLFYKIVKKANELDVISDFIVVMAYEIALANTENEQEIFDILDSLPDSILNSTPYIVQNTAWDAITTLAETVK